MEVSSNGLYKDMTITVWRFTRRALVCGLVHIYNTACNALCFNTDYGIQLLKIMHVFVYIHVYPLGMKRSMKYVIYAVINLYTSYYRNHVEEH